MVFGQMGSKQLKVVSDVPQSTKAANFRHLNLFDQFANSHNMFQKKASLCVFSGH